MLLEYPRWWTCTTRCSAVITRRSGRTSRRPWPPSRVRSRQSSPSPGMPPSRPDGWTSRKTATSPACGAEGRCRPGAGAGCSGRWSPIAPGWPGTGDTGTSRSTRPRTAARSSSGWGSPSWPGRRPSSTPVTRASGGNRVVPGGEGLLRGVVGVRHRPRARVTGELGEGERAVMGRWGARWLEVEPHHQDPAYVLWATLKLVDAAKLPDQTVVVQFELRGRPGDNYWLLLRRPAPELCTRGTGYVEDIIARTDAACLIDIHLKRISYEQALRSGRLCLAGPPQLTAAFT